MELVKNIKNKKYTIMCFSDIHGNYEALKAILEERENLEIDETICLGDVISKGPDSDLCLDLLLKEDIILIEGNNEYFMHHEPSSNSKTKKEIEHLTWVKENLSPNNLECIRNLPNKYVLNFKDLSIQFAHFLFGSEDGFINMKYLYERGIDSKIKRYNNYDIVFYGHQHDTEIRNLSSQKFFCVGSSGAPIDDENVTYYLLITYDKGNIGLSRKKVSYDRESFINKMKTSDYPNRDHYMKETFKIK